MSKYSLDMICWGAFGLVWIIGGIYNHYKVKVIKRVDGSKSSWSIIIGAAAWYVFNNYIPAGFWTLITYNTRWLKIAGGVLLILSTIFTLWSRFVLGRMWAGDTVLKEEHRLRTEGPYSITRHPIYTGMTGMILGSTLMNGFGAALALSICVFIYLKIKIRNEEKLLTEAFGEEYLNFKRRTPQLFPFPLKNR